MTMSDKKCIKVALVDPFEQKVVYQTIPTDSHGSILGGVKLEIDCSLIEQNITKRTKAIIPVHLYGQSRNMSEIIRISKKFTRVIYNYNTMSS